MSKLIDVARAAGVSVATASRALNGRPTVSEEIRRRVSAAAGRLDYRPNLSARALATGARSIAVVVESLADPFIASTAESVARAVRERGHRAMVAVAPSGVGTHWDGVGLAGMVFLGTDPDPSDRERLARLPWLSVVDGARDMVWGMELGFARGCELACRYLRGEGHRKIALVGSIEASVREALGCRIDGIELEHAPVGDTGSIRGPIRSLFARPDPPTAVVCATDLLALCVMRCCANEGMRVPADVSVVGFGDAPFARHGVPALSSVRVSMQAIGASAADAILDLTLGRTPMPRQPAVQIVIRESSGPMTEVSRGA